MAVNTIRSKLRAGLISVALFAFTGGLFLMMAMDYFAVRNELAWVCAGVTVVMIGTAFIIGRRALLEIAASAA